MPGISSRALLLTMTALGKKLGYRDSTEVRRKVEKQYQYPASFAPPKKLGRTCEISLDFRNGWPCYEISARHKSSQSTKGDRNPQAEVLYLHGGAYIEEIGSNHWSLIEQLTRDVPARVTVPIYPLAPRGTATSVLPKITALAATLTERASGPTFFMGDSAGGGMALAIAQRLRETGGRLPDRLVLIAPWLDITLGHPAVPDIEPHDPLLAAEPLRFAGALWAGGLDPADPVVSPVNGEMSGLPRTTVFIGTRDILSAETHRFRDLARAAGVEMDLHEAAGDVHAYPLWPTAEAMRARQQIVETLVSAKAA
ncbi:alpha/beta hydrolase fold domain-containing protein [Streptomyces sp. NPDC017993]|uniref:alpha/beta hydrolase fold domain-containing protein n=1 Tax=Streptomyces sp. NPDC017993 TaxID=3365027 RepID=UPI003792BD51